MQGRGRSDPHRVSVFDVIFRRPLVWASIAVLLLGLAWAGLTFPRSRQARVQLLLGDAQRGAVAFRTGELDQLSGTATDEDTAAYRAVKERLMTLRHVNPEVRFVYIMRYLPETNKVIFLADSEPAESEDVSLPGDKYPEAPGAYGLQAIIHSGEPAWEGPLSDSFGTWFTAYAVAANFQDGRPRDIYGIDVDAGDWQAGMLGESLRAGAYVWFALGLPLVVWTVGRRHIRMAGRIREFSEALDQTFAAVMMVSNEGIIRYVSGGYIRQTHRSREQVIGRHWREFFDNGMSEEGLAEVRSRLRQGLSWQGEWQNTRADGPPFPAFGMVSPVRDSRGRQTGYIVVFDDVTALKRVEADLRAAKEQADAANEAKGRFLATMSHEIRTPLNGVIGVASVLERANLSQDQRDLVQVIQRSGETLLVIINDILDFSRIEAGKIEFEHTPFSIRDNVRDVTELFCRNAASKGVALDVSWEAGVPAHARGDAARLRQVLGNLVSNAIKFTEHGSVRVAVRAKHFEGARFVLEIAVADSGIGISPERRDRLFSAFSQVDASITRRFGGTGLGLVISKRLCELMGGGISVESEEGRGSVFTFTIQLEIEQSPALELPVPVPPPAPESKRSVEPAAGPLRLLLVEDYTINRLVAKRMLGSLGYEADIAEDGVQAVEACRRTSYDVVLMDLEMPNLDGISAAKQIRSEPLPWQPWIIALTADALAGDREKCLAAGMNDYLSKPIVTGRLEEALMRACAGRMAPVS